jgi:riboflavin synthase
MFTGIIEEVGEVTAVQRTGDAARITVRAPIAVADAQHGDSISVSGVCLTVIDQGADWFTADVMAETLKVSTQDAVEVGARVNLERAARVGDRLGGHIVQGHVDGTARVLQVTDGSAWRVVRLGLEPDLAPLVVRKGSIALDGVSLTVSAVGEAPAASGGPASGNSASGGPAESATPWFEVSLIPETLTATALGDRKVGDRVNVETDILARHVERLLALGAHTPDPAGTTVQADRYYARSDT